MKDKFEDVKSWVGGIGKWISDHKGPISYDRRLLIPHGGSIMEGLDEGLQDKFKKVQSNVSSMANKLSDSFTGGLPSLDATINTTGFSPESYKEKSNDGSNSGQKVVNQYITVQAKWNGKGDIQQTMEQMYTRTIQDQRGGL